jgi:hypothetical protein
MDELGFWVSANCSICGKWILDFFVFYDSEKDLDWFSSEDWRCPEHE